MRADLIDYECLAVQPMLAALSAVTDLKRLELTCADVRGVAWGEAPLCALISLCLHICAARHLLPALAQLTYLRSLAVSGGGVASTDVSTFVLRRVQ